MDLKKIFQHILAALLGYLVVLEIYSLIFSVSMIILVTSFGELILSIQPHFFGLLGLLVITLGVYSGIKSFRDRNLFYEIFRPEKNKIIVSVFISLIYVSIAFMLNHSFVYSSMGTIQTVNPVIGIPGTIISYIILFYPFSSLAYYFYVERKSKRFKAKKKVIGLILMLNPVFISISIALSVLIGAALITEPCGVTYDGFLPDSAARDAGMKPQEVIVQIDDVEIKDIYDMRDYLANITYNKTLRIQTDEGNEYLLTLRVYVPENRYMFGITNVTNSFCRKDL